MVMSPWIAMKYRWNAGMQVWPASPWWNSNPCFESRFVSKTVHGALPMSCMVQNVQSPHVECLWIVSKTVHGALPMSYVAWHRLLASQVRPTFATDVAKVSCNLFSDKRRHWRPLCFFAGALYTKILFFPTLVLKKCYCHRNIHCFVTKVYRPLQTK